ncbi:MAG: hypothetical protein WC254_04730 [Candidatus Woesearchaeota archaeon]|jgi:hypothetical protein
MKATTALTGLVGLATIISSGCPKPNKLENPEITFPITANIDEEKLIQYIQTYITPQETNITELRKMSDQACDQLQKDYYENAGQIIPPSWCNELVVVGNQLSYELRVSLNASYFGESITIERQNDLPIYKTDITVNKHTFWSLFTKSPVNSMHITYSVETTLRTGYEDSCSSFEVIIQGLNSNRIVVGEDTITDWRCDGIQYSYNQQRGDSIKIPWHNSDIPSPYSLLVQRPLTAFYADTFMIWIQPEVVDPVKLRTIKETFDFFVEYANKSFE